MLEAGPAAATIQADSALAAKYIVGCKRRVQADRCIDHRDVAQTIGARLVGPAICGRQSANRSDKRVARSLIAGETVSIVERTAACIRAAACEEVIRRVEGSGAYARPGVLSAVCIRLGAPASKFRRPPKVLTRRIRKIEWIVRIDRHDKTSVLAGPHAKRFKSRVAK